MRAVWKYPLKVGNNRILMPWGARILGVMNQHDEIVLYALVLTDNAHESRIFYAVETGADLRTYSTTHLNFVGTCLMQSESYVLHVFEGRELKEAMQPCDS